MPSFFASSFKTSAFRSQPCMEGIFNFLHLAATTGFFSFERTSSLTPCLLKASSPKPSERLQKTPSLPSSRVSTLLSVNTPSKSKTTICIRFAMDDGFSLLPGDFMPLFKVFRLYRGLFNEVHL